MLERKPNILGEFSSLFFSGIRIGPPSVCERVQMVQIWPHLLLHVLVLSFKESVKLWRASADMQTRANGLQRGTPQ